MHLLSFSLSPEQIVELYDAISCLAKFSETVSLEAVTDKLSLSALNQTCSGYASFALQKDRFFLDYKFDAFRARNDDFSLEASGRFTCNIYNKSLLSVFKRSLKEMREKETAIERCDCFFQEDAGDAQCRFVVKMVCSCGVTKTYKLTYEAAEIKHAVYTRAAPFSKWTLSSLTLRSFIEHLGVGTEQLDIFGENGQVTFTSYTEKVTNGKDVLKQPLQTSITLDHLDFSEISLTEDLHIGITTKDFKSIAAHAETLKTNVTAEYSLPYQPIMLCYEESGLRCEFILATSGDYRGPPIPSGASRAASVIPKLEQQSGVNLASAGFGRGPRDAGSMAPPSRNAAASLQKKAARNGRSSPPPPKPSLDPKSLFLPDYDDEDRRWREKDYDEDEDDAVGWSASAVHTRETSNGTGSSNGPQAQASESLPACPDEVQERLPPTQRLSEGG